MNDNLEDNLDHIIDKEIQNNGGQSVIDINCVDADGMTMFDVPGSQDNLITVLIPKTKIRAIAAQSIVEIRSRTKDNGGDGRVYRAAVVGGPFHEPDGIRADANMLVTTTIQGAIFMPNFHGKVHVELIGEVLEGVMIPPRFRPLPNSPVFVLSKEATAETLRVNVDPGITLGIAIGHDDIEVKFPSNTKTVIPRHIGILGTTGGGKSTTISGLMNQFQQKGIATVVIDTEGEYTQVDKEAENPTMRKLLEKRGLEAGGIKNVSVLHPIGRETKAEAPTKIESFSVHFSSLSPYAASDILGLNEAQFGRFFRAYDAAKKILREVGQYPKKGQETEVFEIDEFDSGYPQITLMLLIDIVGIILNKMSPYFEPIVRTNFMRDQTNIEKINRILDVTVQGDNIESSWKALIGKLWQIDRAKIFDNPKGKEIPFQDLINPGQLTIIDLSDSDSTLINNIIIANLLRGIQKVQEQAYVNASKKGGQPTPVSIIIEEAHEFLSKEKIGKMSNLFQQVARIARRGRKRWLGLVFVTQLPQHLPDEVLGLVNSFILHKIGDSNVISQLKRSIGGVDQSQWNRLPNLAPGQAIVTTPSLSRSLLVAIDPSPCKLLMVD